MTGINEIAKVTILFEFSKKSLYCAQNEVNRAPLGPKLILLNFTLNLLLEFILKL